MKYFILSLTLFILCGCGDTINKTEQVIQVQQNTLSITSATYSLYSSPAPTTSGYTKQLNFSLKYDGDIENVTAFTDIIPRNSTTTYIIGPRTRDTLLVWPGHIITYSMGWNSGSEDYKSLDFYFTLVNSHGTESNKALGSLVP